MCICTKETYRSLLLLVYDRITKIVFQHLSLILTCMVDSECCVSDADATGRVFSLMSGKESH